MRLESLIATLCLLLVGACAIADSVPACHNGAYRTRAAELLVIAGGSDKSLRYFLPDGRSGWLRTESDGSVKPVPGWDPAAQAQGAAVLGACDSPSVQFSMQGEAAASWDRIPLQISESDFQSDDVRLHGRLVAPPGERWPLVILVHGGEQAPAIDTYSWQYLLPAQGIAVFVFDKRGTGASSGTYTQNFEVLAKDVVAAAAEARRVAGSRAERVGMLAGSQGGWVAPAAAARTRVDFVIVGFGLLISPLREDRAQILYDLRSRGFDQAALTGAAQIADATARIVRSGFQDGYKQLEALKRRYRGEPWYSQLQGEYTGELLQASEKELRRNGKAKYDNLGVPWDYDSIDPVAALQVPQLWMLGGEDADAPSDETLTILRELQERGKAIDVAVFPRAQHGIVEFKVMPDGTRTRTQYSNGFFDLPADWIRGLAIGRKYGDATLTLHKIR